MQEETKGCCWKKKSHDQGEFLSLFLLLLEEERLLLSELSEEERSRSMQEEQRSRLLSLLSLLQWL